MFEDTNDDVADESRDSESRYSRWRHAITRHVWIIDRHWYEMIGFLFLTDKR